ncbi:hypothetical protein D3C84_671750 [compost metagenome]
MLHLHGFQHHQQLALADPLAFAHQYLDYGAVHGRLDRARASGALAAGWFVGDVLQLQVAVLPEQPELLCLLMVGDAATDAVQLHHRPAAVGAQQTDGDFRFANPGQQSRLLAGFLHRQLHVVFLFALAQHQAPGRVAGAAPAGQPTLVSPGAGRSLIEQGGGDGQFSPRDRLGAQAGIGAELFADKGRGGFPGGEMRMPEQVGEEALVTLDP